MSVISEDLMQMNPHKIKGFSKDFIQRYLNAFADLIKTDKHTLRFNKGSADASVSEDLTCQEFSIWKFLFINVDKKNHDSLAIIFAFILHLNTMINHSESYHSKI